MKIKIICVGILKSGPEFDLMKEYLKRFNWQVEIIEIPVKKGLSGDALKIHEAKLILTHAPSNSPIIVLDERATSPTSPEFSRIIGNFQLKGDSQVIFCIGGADGLDESVRLRANKIISFGQMTWPHMLVRVLLIEQLYRAQQILAGHPYHRV